ncbi:hypothetical protein B0H19DRAFT_1265228 [Mycena capillaripes]|nr:hypothetical protein B0H19DRAFT_1265228 [Mycena capillaripes]
MLSPPRPLIYHPTSPRPKKRAVLPRLHARHPPPLLPAQKTGGHCQAPHRQALHRGKGARSRPTPPRHTPTRGRLPTPSSSHRQGRLPTPSSSSATGGLPMLSSSSATDRRTMPPPFTVPKHSRCGSPQNPTPKRRLEPPTGGSLRRQRTESLGSWTNTTMRSISRPPSTRISFPALSPPAIVVTDSGLMLEPTAPQPSIPSEAS